MDRKGTVRVPALGLPLWGIAVTSHGPAWASGGQTSPRWSVDLSAMPAMAPTRVDLIPSHLTCHLRAQYTQVLDAARPAPRRNAQRWPALAVCPVRRPAAQIHHREQPTAAAREPPVQPHLSSSPVGATDEARLATLRPTPVQALTKQWSNSLQPALGTQLGFNEEQPQQGHEPEAQGLQGLLRQSSPQVFELVVLLGKNLFHVAISCRLLEFLL